MSDDAHPELDFDPYTAPVPDESTGGGGRGLGQHEVAATGHAAQPY